MRRHDREFMKQVSTALGPLLAGKPTRERAALRIHDHLQPFLHEQPKAFRSRGFLDFEGKVIRLVDHFAPEGLTPETYIRAGVKRIQLFLLKPETQISNIEAVARHFQEEGLTCREYLGAATKQPQLFYQKPRTVIGNVEHVVEHFRQDGLTCRKYLRAAVQQPKMFCYTPETIIRHVELITEIYQKGLVELPHPHRRTRTDAGRVLAYLIGRPMLFTLSDDNIALREIYAHVTGARTANRVLRASRERIEEELRNAIRSRSRRKRRNKLPRHGQGPRSRQFPAMRAI